MDREPSTLGSARQGDARSPLISVEDLAEALRGAEPPIVLDVRWHLRPSPTGRRKRVDPAGLDEFDAGHVPGAVFVDLDTELAGPPGPAGRHPLPDPDVLEETLRRAGVDARRRVVVLDGGGPSDGLAAARAWWVLRWAGLPPERVAVLDGGHAAWVAAGHEVSTEGGGVRRPGSFGVAGGGMPVLTADAAARTGVDDTAVLLDGRSPERFRGETEPLDPVAGHVPGAVNMPASGLLADDGRWRSPAEVRELLEPLLGGAGAVGAYCGSGVSAAMLVLALEHAGLRGPEDPAALYVGSWSHWCATKRPVETGATVPP